jgi:hypothetical protein
MFLNIWLFVQSLEAMIYGFAYWAQAHSKEGYGYNFMAWMDFIVAVSVKLYAGSGVLKLVDGGLCGGAWRLRARARADSNVYLLRRLRA